MVRSSFSHEHIENTYGHHHCLLLELSTLQHYNWYSLSGLQQLAFGPMYRAHKVLVLLGVQIYQQGRVGNYPLLLQWWSMILDCMFDK